MGRSSTYKSPAKLKRSYRRLISHLIQSQKKHLLLKCALQNLPQEPPYEIASPRLSPQKLAVPNPTPPEFIGRNHRSKNIKISNVKITNFPEPCAVCQLHQCELDFRHSIYFAVYETLEDSLAKLKKKPPDEETAA